MRSQFIREFFAVLLLDKSAYSDIFFLAMYSNTHVFYYFLGGLFDLQAIKNDAVKSILARFEILEKELIALKEDEGAKPPNTDKNAEKQNMFLSADKKNSRAFHFLPKRSMFTLSSSTGLLASDYSLHEESQEVQMELVYWFDSNANVLLID
jgi:hypothetical protein